MNYFIDLLNSIKRGVISPVYLFYGEETYLQEQAVNHFKNFCAGDGDSGLNYDLVDGETVSPADIVARAETVPFFAEKRLVVVKNPVFFKSAKRIKGEPPKEEKKVKASGREMPLLNYLKDPPTSTCLIFTTNEPVDRRKRFFKAIKKNGRAVDFTFLNRKDLTRWLNQRARKAGKKFAAGASEALLDVAGPSLQRLVVELEKLFNYTAGQEVITPKDVHELCPPRPEENIFAIVDAVGNRRCGEALTGIKEMLAAKEPPFKLLAMVSRQFRLLLQVYDLLERGYPPGEIRTRLNMHPYVCRKIAGQCRNFNRARLIGAVESLSELDVAVKTGRQEFYPALEAFLLKMCAV